MPPSGLPTTVAAHSRGCVGLLDPALHSGEIEALRIIRANRFTVLRCGRRFGKTRLIESLIVGSMLLGMDVAYFAPIYSLSMRARAGTTP